MSKCKDCQHWRQLGFKPELGDCMIKPRKFRFKVTEAIQKACKEYEPKTTEQ